MRNPFSLPTQLIQLARSGRHILLAAILAFGMTAGTGFAHAQGGTTASVGGTVTDTTGAVVPGAAIELKNTVAGDLRSTKSNSSGVFDFSAIPSGNYTLTIKGAGFGTFQQNGIHLDPGDQRVIREIHLKAGATETVTVTSATGQLNLDSGEISSTISAQDVEHLALTRVTAHPTTPPPCSLTAPTLPIPDPTGSPSKT